MGLSRMSDGDCPLNDDGDDTQVERKWAGSGPEVDRKWNARDLQAQGCLGPAIFRNKKVLVNHGNPKIIKNPCSRYFVIEL